MSCVSRSCQRWRERDRAGGLVVGEVDSHVAVRAGLFEQCVAPGTMASGTRCVHPPPAAWFNWRLARYAFGPIGFDGNALNPRRGGLITKESR